MLDVGALVSSLAAYNRTSITNVAVLQVSSVFTAAILSWIYLGRKYSITHALSFLLCGTGVCLAFYKDIGSMNSISGDVLALLSAVFYGVSAFIS